MSYTNLHINFSNASHKLCPRIQVHYRAAEFMQTDQLPAPRIQIDELKEPIINYHLPLPQDLLTPTWFSITRNWSERTFGLFFFSLFAYAWCRPLCGFRSNFNSECTRPAFINNATRQAFDERAGEREEINRTGEKCDRELDLHPGLSGWLPSGSYLYPTRCIHLFFRKKRIWNEKRNFFLK